MKSRLPLVLSAFLLVFLTYLNLSRYTACLPPGRIIEYCNNSTGEISDHGCKEDKRIATIHENCCPYFYESKYTYYIGTDVKNSEKAIYSTIESANRTLNGAVVRIAPEVR